MHLAILTPSYPGTTFAASELDFQVRDVTGYFLTAIDTPKLYFKFEMLIFYNHKTGYASRLKNHVVSTLKTPIVAMIGKENKAKRVISIGQLNALRRLHTQPIKLVVYKHP